MQARLDYRTKLPIGTGPSRAGTRKLGRMGHIVSAMAIVVSVLLAVPARHALACSIGPVDTPPLWIMPSDLPTILESDGTWAERFKADRAEGGIDETPPRFVGAGKSQVVEYFAETDNQYDGATWKMRVAWGTASVQPISHVGGESKDDDSARCYWGTEARLGDSDYWFETETGDIVDFYPGEGADLAAVESELASLFGAPTEVTDDMVTAATIEENWGSGGTSRWSPDEILAGLGVVVGATVAIAWLLGRGD